MSSDLYRWAIQHGMPENLSGDQQALWMHQRELSRDAAIERLQGQVADMSLVIESHNAEIARLKANLAQVKADYQTHVNGVQSAAEKEVERLRAVVDRLPKTADGVTVLPGDIMFARLDGKYERVFLMPDDLKQQILNSIPDPRVLRQRLAENIHEREFIRKMIRLADEKAKVESLRQEQSR